MRPRTTFGSALLFATLAPFSGTAILGAPLLGAALLSGCSASGDGNIERTPGTSGGSSGNTPNGGADSGGGAANGGAVNGGADSGGGAANGGAVNGGADSGGGAANGGAVNGGAVNGGAVNGGAAHGGAVNGGAANGGAANGGAANGGAPNGGAPNGGAANGGAANGGAANGGAANGGAANGGNGGTPVTCGGGDAPVTTTYDFGDKLAPSTEPPAGVKVSEAPQFVSFGWDDNGKVASFRWALDVAKARKNPDGSPVRMSFYLTSTYIATGAANDPKLLKAAWKAAHDDGHEVGLHSITHATGKSTSSAQWNTEVSGNLNALTKAFDPAESSWDTSLKSGVGIPRADIFGWRTPFLGTNDALMPVLKSNKVWYDTSLEEGYQSEQDGTNFLWPYTLDEGSPGDQLIASWGPNEGKAPITKHAGLWELPVYTFIVPPELRATMKARKSFFNVETGKVTGFDYNLMVTFSMTKAEYLATLKYSLDQRLAGNRAPFLIGAHTDYYDASYTAATGMTMDERRAAIEEFIDYALTKPEVRLKSYKQVLDWMRAPVKLSCD